jgi:hypothetical protein
VFSQHQKAGEKERGGKRRGGEGTRTEERKKKIGFWN